jgi:hypothetical protein
MSFLFNVNGLRRTWSRGERAIRRITKNA